METKRIGGKFLPRFVDGKVASVALHTKSNCIIIPFHLTSVSSFEASFHIHVYSNANKVSMTVQQII